MPVVAPSPENFTDWRAWGRALLFAAFTQTGRGDAVRLPLYSHGNKPKATENGLVIFVFDDTLGAIPLFSYNNEWYRFGNEPPSVGKQLHTVELPPSVFTRTNQEYFVTIS